MPTLIPYKFKPRNYQIPLLKFMDNGGKRAFLLWHRRSGKDKLCFNLIVKSAFERVGVYYYMFPTFALGKKVIWHGIDKNGFKVLDHIPYEAIRKKNESDMMITLVNGSIVQIIGTDKYNSIRGPNPVGCVFSEYAYQSPAAWDVFRPILRENGGWAIFNTTPNGENHAFDLWKMAEDNPDWFTQQLTINETGVLTEQDMIQERMEGMPEDMVQQEYFCAFNVGAVGSYYSDLVKDAKTEGRVAKLPIYHDIAVDAFFDIGMNDMTSIWFVQRVEGWYNFINFYEDNNKTLDHYGSYIKEYMQEKRLKLGDVYLPHDARKRDWSTGTTPFSAMSEVFGEHKVQLVERPDTKMYAINATRQVFPNCRFDSEACEYGVRCLNNYHKEWDENRKVFKPLPMHDWSSHAADAFSYFALTAKQMRADDRPVDKAMLSQIKSNMERIKRNPIGIFTPDIDSFRSKYLR